MDTPGSTLGMSPRVVLVLQAFYSVRSERQLMEQIDYKLFRRAPGTAMEA